MTTDVTPVADLTYEGARDELVSLVRALEAGTKPLAESMTMFERAEQLADRCEQLLTQAAARLESVAEPDKPTT